MYTALEHYIDGNWVKPTGAKKQDVINPANSKAIGELGHVSRGDLDKALAAVDKGFKTTSPRYSPRSRARSLPRRSSRS